jgi:hypothetical protein
MPFFSADDVLVVSDLLLNDKLDAAADYLHEKIKGGHNHLEEAEIGTRIAKLGYMSVEALGLERSSPGLIAALAERLFAQADDQTVTILRRLLALAAEKRAGKDQQLRVRMRERAKATKLGTSRRDFIDAVRDGREPGDEIALELLADLLHLHVRLLREDGSQEKEVKCAGPPLAVVHLLPAGNTFCTLIVSDFKGSFKAAPADNVPKPSPAWVPPVVGERVEVEVEVDGWCPAVVLAVKADGQFKVQTKVAPNSYDSSVTPSEVASPPPSLPMDLWLTWEEEGKDWRRPAHAVAAPAPASPVTVPASPDASDDTGSSPPTRPTDAPVAPHAGSGGEDRSIRAGRAISAAAAIDSSGGGDATSDGGGVVVGGLKKRPPGRTPHGANGRLKVWNGVTGAWDEARGEAQAEGALAEAGQPAAQAEGGGDGVTDVSKLLKAVGALTKRQLTPVPAPADAPVESEATELRLKPPEQPTKMVALLAQCSAVKAEGVEVDAATAACLEMCTDKERALHTRTNELESKVAQAEEALQQLERCSESLQKAGIDTTKEVRAKLNNTNSSLKQLQGQLVSCGKALAFVQSLPEQLQQQVPPPTPHSNPFPALCPRPCPRHRLCLHLTVSTHPTGRRRTRARCAAREWQICPRSCRAARRRFPPS